MHRTLAYIALVPLLALAGCRSKFPERNDEIMVIGHGGAGFDTYRNTIPANTRESVERALRIEGADAVEVDVQLTADSILVLFHDPTLHPRADCEGCIPDMTMAEVTACGLSGRHGPLNGDFRIPTLESIFAAHTDDRATFFLNPKTQAPCAQAELDAYRDRMARAFADLIETHGLHTRTYIETSDIYFLETCKRIDPALQVIFDEDNFDKALSTTQKHGFEGFAIVNEKVTQEQVAQARAAGKICVIWGVRIWSGTVQAVEKNPDAIMTEDIRMLRHVLRR